MVPCTRDGEDILDALNMFPPDGLDSQYFNNMEFTSSNSGCSLLDALNPLDGEEGNILIYLVGILNSSSDPSFCSLNNI